MFKLPKRSKHNRKLRKKAEKLRRDIKVGNPQKKQTVIGLKKKIKFESFFREISNAKQRLIMLRKSKGNMYEWVDFQWNPIKGKCHHDCSYCYVKKWGELNPVRLDEKEFKEFDRDIKKYGEGQTIFVGSGCDMFAEDIPMEWITKVLNYLNKYDNTYLFQSKNPAKFIKYLYSKLFQNRNVIFCTTIETNRHYPKIMNNSPKILERVEETQLIVGKIPIYVTIEPIMDFDLIALVGGIRALMPKQVNIGADSGGNKLPEPSKEKTLKLIAELEKFTTVKIKKNLNRIIN